MALVNDIYEHVKLKETEELLRIWEENDHSQYSGEAFQAIEQILRERNINPPKQNDNETMFRIKYDPKIIYKYVERLNDKASRIIVRYTLLYGFIGALVGYYFEGAITAVIGFVLAGAVGFNVGYEKAFYLKLIAQLTLCQVKIEYNTSSVNKS